MNSNDITNKSEGSVLIFALLLLVVGALVLGAIAQKAATQAAVGEVEWEMMNRRVTLENSRTLAQEWIKQVAPKDKLTNITFVHTNYGRFSLVVTNASRPSIGSTWDALTESNNSATWIISPFNIMERGGFYRLWISGTLWDGATNVPWTFQVRTRSPFTAGYTVFKSPVPPTNNYLWTNNLLYNLPIPPYGFRDTSESEIKSDGSFTNVSYTVASGAATSDVNLKAGRGTNSDKVLFYEVPEYYTNATGVSYPLKNLVIDSDTSGFNVEGLVIVRVKSPTKLENIEFGPGNNKSRVFLIMERENIGGQPTINITAASNPNWRLYMMVSNFKVNFTSTKGDFQGAFQSDSDVMLNGTPGYTPNFKPDDVAYFNDMFNGYFGGALPGRFMWTEDFRQP